MRPVRFVALSEDGQAFVLTDEVGRLLTLPIDERIHAALRAQSAPTSTSIAPALDPDVILSPRDIQARIRAGESADEVARIAGVAVDRVLRYAGPVLQERAMLAQQARRTKVRGSERAASLAEMVDARLAQHGIDAEKISWDAYRRDDGTWRVVATWPSGKASAQATWELDRGRGQVWPHDEMAQYLCADRPAAVLGHDPFGDRVRTAIPPGRSESGRDLGRGGHEPMRTPVETSRPSRSGRADPIRAGRDALMATLDRPSGADADPMALPGKPAARTDRRAGGGAFDDDLDAPKEVPAVPSLAVLRPRRTAVADSPAAGPDDKPRKRLPGWEDVLFGSPPAARSADGDS